MPSSPRCRERTGGRSLAVELVPHLDRWVGVQPFTPDLHSGDVGWHLRHDDRALADVFRVWELDGEVAAGGFVDDGFLRLAVAPERRGDLDLARSVADGCTGLAYVDVSVGTSARDELLRRGWSADPDPWVLLHRELGPADAAHADPATRPVDGPDEVGARVAVQRSAFAPGSTFTPELWERMTTGPTYDGRFEQVTWTPDGQPAAAATGWFAGPGRCAILEPVGTHADHRRQGYGGRVNLAVLAALAEAGASGVRVHTPASNEAAVRAYEACGMRAVDWTVALQAPPLVEVRAGDSPPGGAHLNQRWIRAGSTSGWAA